MVQNRRRRNRYNLHIQNISSCDMYVNSTWIRGVRVRVYMQMCAIDALVADIQQKILHLCLYVRACVLVCVCGYMC